jgi:type IV secretory pathway TrbD component
VSDSILYLAIVAIWAIFLIPAWVRRPHSTRSQDEAELETSEFTAEYDYESELTVSAPADAEAEVPGDVAVELDARLHLEMHQRNSEYRDDVRLHSYDSAEDAVPHSGQRPSQSREQMMRARRRMLTILTGLTVVTGLFVLAGLVQWWICVPPIAMLALYVALLREIAMADAELAAKRHAWEVRQAADAARARAAHAEAWRRSQRVWEAEAPEPTAEIIDISSRVGDQLYDQYADAAVRAVGD